MLESIDHPLPRGVASAGRIVEWRLARPPVNALDPELVARLVTAFERPPTDAKALIISGQPGVFSAGLDVRALLALDRVAAHAFFELLWRLQAAVARAPIPSIFAITGHCPAGGTVFAMSGDYRVMADGDFRIGLNEVQVGLYPGPPIHAALVRLVGPHRAAQLLTRGAMLSPRDARQAGLVDEVAPPHGVVERALAIAGEMVSAAEDVMRRTRALVRADLVALFGAAGEATRYAAEFAEQAGSVWWSEATRARLTALFARAK